MLFQCFIRAYGLTSLCDFYVSPESELKFSFMSAWQNQFFKVYLASLIQFL